MTHQTMIEWSSPAYCYVKGLGDCEILQNTLGSNTCNPQFLVKIVDTGFIRTVDQNDIALYGNPAAGEKLQSDVIIKWRELDNQNIKTNKNADKRRPIGFKTKQNGDESKKG